MCMPLGPRRGGWGGSTSNEFDADEAKKIIRSGRYECLYREGKYVSDIDEYTAYDGCQDNLEYIIDDAKTKLKLADGRHGVYDYKYQTIIVEAPVFPATLLIRKKIRE